jgi:uncharacterized membrane protein YfcA
VVAFFVVLVAAATQSLTGFGYALLAVPLLALLLDPHTAVVGAAVAGLALTLGTTAAERAHVQWRATGTLVFFGALGIPLGLIMLASMSDRALRILIAIVVLLCTAQVWRGVRLPQQPVVVAIAGFVSGTLGASTGTNGPPLVAAFQAMGYDPRQFRATLGAVFTFTGAVGLVGFVIAGQFTQRAALIGLGTVPGALLGWLAGNRLFARIPVDVFRTVVLGALTVSAVVTGVRALRG